MLWGMRLALAVLVGLAFAAPGAERGEPRPEADPEPFRQRIPGSLFELPMVPIPAGQVTDGEGEKRAVGGYWMSAVEVTWDAFDAFVFEELRADLPDGVDALARPTKPYISADRGFGREGYPVLSVSLASAQAFCDWLSAHTGRRWRLPDEIEWTHAALAGGPGPWHGARHGAWYRAEAEPAFDGRSAAGLEHVAWFRQNAGGSTHPVASLAPNAFGLYDMHGNVAEWVTTADGRGLLAGGSFLDGANQVAASARKRPEARWNASDPNLPKSRWWLADAPFAGFRVIAEPIPEPTAEPTPGSADGRDEDTSQ